MLEFLGILLVFSVGWLIGVNMAVHYLTKEMMKDEKYLQTVIDGVFKKCMKEE